MLKYQSKKYFMYLFFLTSFFSCGKGVVDLGESNYDPKIVVQGYIYPGHRVEKIFITRNVPLSQNINITLPSIVISDADVRIRDMQTDSLYPLTYNPMQLSYEYYGADLQIGYGKSYRIEVSAMIDSQQLNASSVTEVPRQGFSIRHSESRLDSMSYRMKIDDALQFFRIRFNRSPNTDFYLFSFTALDGDSSTFVYSPENPFADADTQDVVKDLPYFKYTTDFAFNTPLDTVSSRYTDKEILWFSLWFYGNYRAVVYACDRNYRDFVLTYNDVQEWDGNFHEPRMKIEGDGIGVFGSMITDTAYFRITR